MYLFPGPRPKKGLSSNGFTKTVTVRLRSIVPKRPTAHGLLRFGVPDSFPHVNFIFSLPFHRSCSLAHPLFFAPICPRSFVHEFYYRFLSLYLSISLSLSLPLDVRND